MLKRLERGRWCRSFKKCRSKRRSKKRATLFCRAEVDDYSGVASCSISRKTHRAYPEALRRVVVRVEVEGVEREMAHPGSAFLPGLLHVMTR